MKPSFVKRLTIAKRDYEEGRWLTRMQGGLGYDVYVLEMELDYECEHGIRTIHPNKAGLWLIVLGQEVRWRFQLLRFIVTGKQPDWMHDYAISPMRDHHGGDW